MISTSFPAALKKTAYWTAACWKTTCRTAAVWLLGVLAATVGSAEESKDDLEFYERKIRPLLSQRCYECHSRNSKRLEGELALDTRAGFLKGGENGPIVARNKPEESLLLQVVSYDGDIQMPPDGKLRAEEIALLREWVRRGAPLPDDGSATAEKRGIDFEAGRKFWSFQPLRHTAAPPVRDPVAGSNTIDLFWQAALEKQGLKPSPPADPRTLIRRATFDLIGLPPTAEEVDEFEQSAIRNPQSAISALIDRLLSSPHYGERWGRYWLDLARFADGNTTSLEVRSRAWLYRDWIVRALNEDMPYDEFVCRQLAADQMTGTPPEELAALGFLGISPDYFKELKLAPSVIKSIVSDEWEERIDALGRTFLGLSLACARCHDHKYDPVSADDYYALAGVLASTRLIDRFVIPEPQATAVRKAHDEVRSLGEQVKQLKAAKSPTPEGKTKVTELENRIKELEQETPHFHAAMAHAVDDAALYVLPNGPDNTKLEYKPGEALDLAVQIRGNPAKLGRTVQRRFLTVLSPGSPQPFTHGSGRLELAQAIVGQAAPLSARVIVNRVWAHHFGRGLVETVSDFGVQGERPSHPELLDDLTSRFINHGWSLKWLHREIMTSAAYQQSSLSDSKNADVNPQSEIRNPKLIDPANRLLWRMNRRRLDVEAWRDAILAACGNLDRSVGGPSVTLAAANNNRRTLYGKIDRSDPDDMLRLFDFPDPSTHAPNREPTTTALQQLFVLNGPFMIRQSATLASRLMEDKPADVETIVRRAYRWLFARQPRADELQLGTDFLTSGEAGKMPTVEMVQQYAQALLGSNEFLFVD